MDPQNFGPDCILGRNLKVLLRQSFNSLLQFFVAACKAVCRDSICFFNIFISVTTKFPLSRQIFLWLFNTLSCKVYCSIYSMSRQSDVCLLEPLCCDIDNCVATLFLCSFFKLCSNLVLMSR